MPKREGGKNGESHEDWLKKHLEIATTKERKRYFTRGVICFWIAFFLFFAFPVLFLMPSYVNLPRMVTVPSDEQKKAGSGWPEWEQPNQFDFECSKSLDPTNDTDKKLYTEKDISDRIPDGARPNTLESLLKYLVVAGPQTTGSTGNITTNASSAANTSNATLSPAEPGEFLYRFYGPCRTAVPRLSFCAAPAGNQESPFCIDPYSSADTLFVFAAWPASLYIVFLVNGLFVFYARKQLRAFDDGCILEFVKYRKLQLTVAT